MTSGAESSSAILHTAQCANLYWHKYKTMTLHKYRTVLWRGSSSYYLQAGKVSVLVKVEKSGMRSYKQVRERSFCF